LEEGLQLREKKGEGEVVVISMGPEGRTQKILREALSKGADRCIHIVEDNARETDPLQTAKILSSAIKDEQFDLILSGLQSLDLGMGQTGVILGELLGMSTATLVMATELTNDSIRVKRELESGWFQWVTLPLPVCLSIQSGLNQPRYPSLKGIMGAKKKEIKSLSKGELIDGNEHQSITRVYSMQKAKQTEMISGDVSQQISRLVDVMKTEIKVL
jgi:electron transfer flavoprotein beta subunit